MTKTADQPKIMVSLASPRGFCAGVERAIRTVEEALAAYGAPIFVRHEIVHNKHVVRRLSAMGVIFIDELEQAPDDRPVIFSAHGAPQTVFEEARKRNLIAIDATCPLVLKVHNQIRRFVASGRRIVMIGHAGHPEVIGAMGQAETGAVILVETVQDVAALPALQGPLAYVTQTTLSVDDTQTILNALKARFPHIIGPSKDDICYATTNRQEAVKTIAPTMDMFVVIGSPTSSNSQRLVDVAIDAGAKAAVLTEDAGAFNWKILENVQRLGLSAGASAPESLVEEFLTELAARRTVTVETIETARENISFKTPLKLAS